MPKKPLPPIADTSVLNLRGMPRELIANLKAASAFAHKPLKDYVIELLGRHVEELQKQGALPKRKE